MLQNIKSRIKNFFNQFFCKHHYSFVGSHPYFYYEDTARTKKHDCSVDFFECKHCGKRKFIGNEEPAIYKNKVWQELKMWKNHEIDIDFNTEDGEVLES